MASVGPGGAAVSRLRISGDYGAVNVDGGLGGGVRGKGVFLFSVSAELCEGGKALVAEGRSGCAGDCAAIGGAFGG